MALVLTADHRAPIPVKCARRAVQVVDDVRCLHRAHWWVLRAALDLLLPAHAGDGLLQERDLQTVVINTTHTSCCGTSIGLVKKRSLTIWRPQQMYLPC